MDIPATRAQHKVNDAEVTVICAVNGKRTSVLRRNTIVQRVSEIVFHLVLFYVCIIMMVILVYGLNPSGMSGKICFNLSGHI